MSDDANDDDKTPTTVIPLTPAMRADVLRIATLAGTDVDTVVNVLLALAILTVTHNLKPN